MKHGSEKDERHHDGTGVGFLLQGGVDIALAMAFGDEPGLIRAIVTMVAVIAVAIAGSSSDGCGAKWPDPSERARWPGANMPRTVPGRGMRDAAGFGAGPDPGRPKRG